MSITLGRAAKQAVIFLRQFHKDIYSLIQAMDEAQLARGWQSYEPNRISAELGNGLNARSWLLGSLYRLYIPAKQEHPRQALAVYVALAPEDYEEAMVLMAAVRLPKGSERTGRALWDGWTASAPVLRFLAGAAQPGEWTPLSKELYEKEFFPGAESVQAVTLPLCELTSTEVLRQRLLNPALTLAAALFPGSVTV
jgi:hypothetical protein